MNHNLPHTKNPQLAYLSQMVVGSWARMVRNVCRKRTVTPCKNKLTPEETNESNLEPRLLQAAVPLGRTNGSNRGAEDPTKNPENVERTVIRVTTPNVRMIGAILTLDAWFGSFVLIERVRFACHYANCMFGGGTPQRKRCDASWIEWVLHRGYWS